MAKRVGKVMGYQVLILKELVRRGSLDSLGWTNSYKCFTCETAFTFQCHALDIASSDSHFSLVS